MQAHASIRCGERPSGRFSERERHLLLALDYDLVALLPEGGHLWNWVRQTLNLIKLPSPALELTPDLRFHLLYPFRL